jgi:hypothetical protein
MFAFFVAVIVGSLGVVIAGIYFTTAFLVKIVTNHWDMIIFFLVLLIIIRVYRGRYFFIKTSTKPIKSLSNSILSTVLNYTVLYYFAFLCREE